MLSILKICSGLWLQNSNYSLFPSGSLCRGILVHFAAEQVDLFTAESMDPFARILQLPAWKNNIKLLDNLDKIEGLYDQFKKQNEILRQYSKLRIESFELIRKAVDEDSNKYDRKIEELNLQIEILLKKL